MTERYWLCQPMDMVAVAVSTFCLVVLGVGGDFQGHGHWKMSPDGN